MPRRFQCLALAVFLCMALGIPAQGRDAVKVERKSYLMGTLCTISGEADDRRQALDAMESAFAAIRATEDLLSTWRDDTPLAALAGSDPGKQVVVDADLARVLAQARSLWGRTLGAFDPSIGSLVEAWDLRGEGRTPTPVELAEAFSRSGMQHVVVDVKASTVRIRVPGLSFDAGGFGKGEALARAAAALDVGGLRAWRINFGGQVLLGGGGGERQVDIAHPARRKRPIATLNIDAASVATSSLAERPGHILDPRSGRPATDIGSVTVVGPDPMATDALATGLFVLGPEQGLQLAAHLDDVHVLYIVRRGEGWVARGTAGFNAIINSISIPVEVSQPAPINVQGALPLDCFTHPSEQGPDHAPVTAVTAGRWAGEFRP